MFNLPPLVKLNSQACDGKPDPQYKGIKSKCCCEYDGERHWGSYSGIGILDSARRLAARVLRESKVTVDEFPLTLTVSVSYDETSPMQKIELEFELASLWKNSVKEIGKSCPVAEVDPESRD